MGLLSKLTGKVTPQKKPTDDALLLHAMLLMCGADGNFDDQEIPTVEAYFNALPEFEGIELPRTESPTGNLSWPASQTKSP